VIGAGWEFTTVPAGLRRAHRARRCAGDHSGTPLTATERFSVRHYAEGAAGAEASRDYPRVISNWTGPCHAMRSAMGLPSLAEYKAILAESYGKPVN
jgi:hypothetical protein